MQNLILRFIKRFKDCDWLAGNCYYFAVILTERFAGDIYYDVAPGHFVAKIEGEYYDYNGAYKAEKPIPWKTFKEYDSLQYKRIIRDCIENETI